MEVKIISLEALHYTIAKVINFLQFHINEDILHST